MRTARPTIHRLTGGLAALALGVTLTACGSSEDSTSAEDPAAGADSSSQATTGSSDDPSESASSSAAVIDEGGQVAPDQFAQMIKDGIENTKTAHVVFKAGSAAGGFTGDGDVDYSTQPPDMQLTMKLSGQAMKLVLVDGVMYIESPQQPGKFMKYDLSDPSNPLGSQFVDQLDPAKAMTQFADALSSVESKGEEDVDGQTLAHYVMTIDTGKLSNASQAAGMPKELTADVWLDDQNRMAKSSIDLGQGGTYDTTLSDFDEPVDIQAPPASQVVDPSQM